MREEPIPAAIAVKCCQRKKGLIIRKAPELACKLESALVLGTGGLNRAGAHGLPKGLAGFVIHPVLVQFPVDSKGSFTSSVSGEDGETLELSFSETQKRTLNLKSGAEYDELGGFDFLNQTLAKWLV